MTDWQFLVLVGTVWIAPTADALQAKFVGLLVLIFAACKGLELL